MRIAALLLLSVLIGCSSKMMDNKTAEERVSYYLKKDQNFIFVDIGRVAIDCGTSSRDKDVKLGVDPTSDLEVLVVQAAGDVTVTQDGPGFWKIEPTEKGKADIVRELVVTDQKGCNYKPTWFAVAIPTLVRITGITANENVPEVEYQWKWNVTELGQALKANGKAYALLDPDQRERLAKYKIFGKPTIPIPVPEENGLEKGVMQFKKYTDGWRRQ
jgi:hypothetical protein